MTSQPNTIIEPPFTDAVGSIFFLFLSKDTIFLSFKINCDYLSLDQMERWVICKLLFLFLLIFSTKNINFQVASPLCLGFMSHPECIDMFKSVLLNSHIHSLYRDDCVQTHSFLTQCLEATKK